MRQEEKEGEEVGIGDDLMLSSMEMNVKEALGSQRGKRLSGHKADKQRQGNEM